MPCGWEGNRRSGVALAMRHRLQWFIYLRAHSLMKGDEHPAYTVFMGHCTAFFYLGYVPSTVYVYADDILTSYT